MFQSVINSDNPGNRAEWGSVLPPQFDVFFHPHLLAPPGIGHPSEHQEAGPPPIVPGMHVYAK